jgi:hypothetical protein
MNRIIRFAAAVALTALVAVPSFAQRGSADFNRFVTLGDSYGAGVVSGSLNERHQVWSWAAVMARQVGYSLCQPTDTAAEPCFAQPLVTYPGIGPELQLTVLSPPTIVPAPGQGTPVMTTFGRPYNNLSIPGATVGALLTLTGAEPPTAGEPTAVSMARFILRGQGTAVQQALVQQPTFIAMWIGGNDALSTLFSGTPATLTSEADFKARYEAVLSALVAGAPNAGMVVGNLPTVPLPYMLLIPPVVVNPATGQPVLIGGQPVPLIADLGDGTIGPLPTGSYVLLHARANLSTGYGLPNLPPFNALPNAGKPLPNGDVLTPAEFNTIITRVTQYNKIITDAAAARNIPVANIQGLFAKMYAPGGYHLGPITVSAAPVQGGFFGLDFFHLTDLGYLLFANEYIRTINAAYDTEIPVASIAQLYANNGAMFPETDSANLEVSQAAIEQIRTMWAQPTMKRVRRMATN